MTVLWLCSWFPDKNQPHNGDFIQRQSQATSQFVDITTMHVAGLNFHSKKELENVESVSTTLQHIVKYFRLSSSRLLNNIRYFQSYYSLWQKYTKNLGRRPDLIHVNICLRDGLFALFLHKRYKIPYVVTEHWTLYVENDGADYQSKKKIFRYFTKRVLRSAACILPVSNDLGNAIKKIVPESTYRKVSNVVDTSVFCYLKEENNKFTFIHVSDMNPIKRVAGIVAAFEKLQTQFDNIQLVLVGNKKGSSSFENEDILILDHLSHESLSSVLNQSNVFVLNSVIENQPCVLLEALSCGLPCISTNVGGVAEELQDGENGFIVDLKDPTTLFEAMKNVYLNYKQFDRQAISVKARAKYSYEAVGRQIFEIYNAVLDNKKDAR